MIVLESLKNSQFINKKNHVETSPALERLSYPKHHNNSHFVTNFKSNLFKNLMGSFNEGIAIFALD